MKTTLSDIEIYAYHGVLPQERTVGGWYCLDVSVTAENCPATETDELCDTINYAEIFDIAKQEMAIPSKLIEHVAGRIIRRIRKEFPTVDSATVRLTKKHPPIPGANVNATVEITL